MSCSRRITLISLIIPSISSSSMTLAKKREKFQLEGTARTGSAGGGNSMRETPVSGSVTTRGFGLRWIGRGSKPQASIRLGLRASSRSSDSGLSCWKTMPASSACHIARTG
jgi:hypothetical protein